LSEALAEASRPSAVRPSFGYQTTAPCASRPLPRHASMRFCTRASGSPGFMSMNRISKSLGP
jgi:hypothetical protein